MAHIPIYKDHTGRWREQNPHFIDTHVLSDWRSFEQSITYHPFPNPPETKQGEVVMARLQIKHTKGWSNLREDEIDTYKNSNAELRWVAANQSNQEKLIEKGLRTGGFIFPETVNEVKEYERVFGPPDEFEYLPDAIKDTSFLEKGLAKNQEGKKEQAKEPVVDNLTAKLINAAKYGYEFHRTTQFPDLSFNEGCRNNFLQYLQTFESPSAPKVESAEEVFNRWVNIRTVGNEVAANIIEAMEQYATLKTSSLQQENDKLRDEVERLTKALTDIKKHQEIIISEGNLHLSAVWTIASRVLNALNKKA